MKESHYLLLACGLLSSCKSDDITDISSDRISSIERISTVGYGVPPLIERHAFVYDERGLLKKVDERVFYYGVNDKAEYSRVFLTSFQPNGNSVYVERLSYRWDAQGRLIDINLDSLYKKTPAIPGGISTDGPESLIRNIVLASYKYNGTDRKPSAIFYRPITHSGSNIIIIGDEEKVEYTYEGGNVSSSVRTGKINSSGHPVRMTTVNTYLPNKHHFAEIYDKLGFHPYNFAEVVPQNCVNTSERKVDGFNSDGFTPPKGGDINFVDISGDVISFPFVFTGKATYSYHFNDMGLPIEITEGGDGVTQRTVITYK
jgi:hypothetical protein